MGVSQMVFPAAQDIAAPSPWLFAEELRRADAPLPTNSPWQNFGLNKGSEAEYIHPYLIQSEQGSLSICYPARVAQSGFIYQVFVANLIISACVPGNHVISRFDDLSVTLKLPGPMTVPLVRGSPYITCIVQGGRLSITSAHAALSVTSANNNTKHKVVLNNGQTWLIYTSLPLYLNHDLTVSGSFRGVLRIAVNPQGDDCRSEEILDRFSVVYPISGSVDLSEPFAVKYGWKKQGLGNLSLLMLSHAVHRQIMAYPTATTELAYRSIDGDLVGVVGDYWVLKETPITVSWHSIGGFDDRGTSRVIESLQRDVDDLRLPISSTNTYFYGKAMARAARLAVIAEEIPYESVVPRIRDFLEKSLTPWLDGTFAGNAILYDGNWGGLVSRRGADDATADFGLGVYNDHHYHLGYFCYAGAVLAKLNGEWGRRFKPHLYAIAGDFLTVNESDGPFTRLRNFDLWALHSWASGVVEFPDGRNQESSSEAVNAYYSAALLGLAYGDCRLVGFASTLAALEIRAAKAWWHVPSGTTVYEPEFVQENRVVGIVWANKRENNLWFAAPEWRERRLGIQVLPIVPLTELLFSDMDYVRELVEWSRDGDGTMGDSDGWKGFVYALEGIYDRENAATKIALLRSHDDGNSLTNLLWWIYTRKQ